MAVEFRMEGGPEFNSRDILQYTDSGPMPSQAQVRQSRVMEAMADGNWEPFWRLLKQKDKSAAKKMARAATVFESAIDEDDDLRRQAKTLEALADVREATGPDFYPYIIGANLRTKLVKGYTNQETYYQNFCAEDTVSDFERHYFDFLGGFGAPSIVPPGAEYPEVKQAEYQGYHSVDKYGVILSMQWEQKQADKLNAFGRQLQQVGAGFATVPDSLATVFYYTNAATTYDSITVMHASSHGANLVTSDLSESVVNTGIGQGLTLTDWAGNKAPVRYTRLMVYPTLHDVAKRICESPLMLVSGLASTSAFTSLGNINPVYSYGLSWFPNPYLATATDWALFPDPGSVPCITHTTLEGYSGILFFSEAKDSGTYFERDLIRFKVMRVDGVYAQDHRYYGRTG